MSFFKDFKDDFSEALDVMVTGTAAEEETSNANKATKPIETDVDADTELSKLDGLLEKVAKSVEEKPQAKAEPAASAPKKEPEKSAPAPKVEQAVVNNTARAIEKEFAAMDTNDTMSQSMDMENTNPVFVEPEPVSDENAVITRNMKITGDLESTGSIEVQGLINGNVRCNGKLTVAGTLNGNSTSAEFFADAARIQGEISSTGTVKIGVNSIVIGNISATSAVIAGAVKGDIDIQGPVVVDSSAVVAGNIVSKSVQINNGAVIEGFCSQKYADMDVNSVFER